MKILVSEDGFEMDSMTYARRSRNRYQAAQDLFAVAAVLKECMQEAEALEKRRKDIIQEVIELKQAEMESILGKCKKDYLLLVEDAKKKISNQCEHREIRIMKEGFEKRYRVYI